MPGGMYESNRERFNKIVDSYLNYAALYKLFNNGSLEGVTPFEVFYWRMTYEVRYAAGENVSKGF